MIEFHCWYCAKCFRMPEERIGERINCTCKCRLRVPQRSGGNCRIKTVVDWVIELVLYGGGGAFLGLGLAVLILSRLPIRGHPSGWGLVVALTVIGFLAGLFGGERGLTWVGRMIREREKR